MCKQQNPSETGPRVASMGRIMMAQVDSFFCRDSLSRTRGSLRQTMPFRIVLYRDSNLDDR